MPRLFASLACALLVAAPVAHAGKVLRWVDANGVVHYGDHVPQSLDVRRTRVQRIATAAEPTAIAALRLQPSGPGVQAIAENRLAGPIEVRLDFLRPGNAIADPVLPARTVVPARGRIVVAYIDTASPGLAPDFELGMQAEPGDPRARPVDADYVLPLRMRGWRIDQGFGGSFSHSDPQNRYAIDLAAPVGTPVLAARDGVVMEVESDFSRAGLDAERYAGRANFIRLLHDDGTMTMYAHLALDGVLVRPGQTVRAGQVIGRSGNTGFTTAPHLHFAVLVNRGMRIESIPFRMRGPDGPLNLRGN